jgi:hypothetical protein
VQVNGKQHKMYGSTPSGRSQSYSYYITKAKPKGSKLRIPCDVVDAQIQNWLQAIAIDPQLVPAIREIYRSLVNQMAHKDRDEKLAEINRRISQLREEELHLGRLIICGKLSEEAYDRLRSEWQEKRRNAEIDLADMQRDATMHLDDLDVALALLTCVFQVYGRLDGKERHTLLRIIAKRIIIDVDGEIVDQQLQTPFAYLRSLAEDFLIALDDGCGSEQFRFGAPPQRTSAIISWMAAEARPAFDAATVAALRSAR